MMTNGQLLQTPRIGKRPYRPANVLIVDDDVDSAVQVGSVFSHLGCQTLLTADWVEAKKRICSLKADVIVLDWLLDRNIDAGQVVKQCARTIAKYSQESRSRLWRKPKIITFSSLSEVHVRLPANSYFDHLAHWKKPITQRELLFNVLNLLNGMDQEGRI